MERNSYPSRITILLTIPFSPSRGRLYFHSITPSLAWGVHTLPDMRRVLATPPPDREWKFSQNWGQISGDERPLPRTFGPGTATPSQVQVVEVLRHLAG